MPTSLLENFKKFINIVEDKSFEEINNLNFNHLSASLILPLLQYIESHNIGKYNFYNSLEGYFEEIVSQKKECNSQFYFMKLKKFPKNYFYHSNKIDKYVVNCSDDILESIPIDLDYTGTYFLLFELLNNVFKHSLFESAYVLCQTILDENIVEICIIDNGISIPKRLSGNNLSFFNDSEAIFKAINGATSDKEKEKLKGRGLNTCANIISFGFEEELLIASRNGLVTVNKYGVKCMDDMDSFLEGTLICLRINTKKFNIYNYLKHIEFKRL